MSAGRPPGDGRVHPRVAVIFTGGTISMRFDTEAGGAVPVLAGADLLALVPGIGSIAEIVAIDRGRTPASHFSFADVLAIGAAIEAALVDPRVAGVVVVQGTDTLEETSFAWDLCHADPRPVIVTGAMRNASDPGWDGPANLRGAVRVAAHPAARGAGVLVELDGLVIAADDVGKRHSTALDAFAAQGKVNVLSSPRVLAMNNEPAVMRIGTQDVRQELPADRRVVYDQDADFRFHLGSVAPVRRLAHVNRRTTSKRLLCSKLLLMI